MKKKWLILFVVACIVTTTTGCSLGGITLTDAESQEIAEYTAYLLLKYDRNYSPTLMYRDDYDKEVARRVAEAEAAAMTPTPTVTPATPEQEPAGPQGSEPDEPEVTEEPLATVDELFGLKNFKVSFAGSDVRDEYKTDTEYFSISAPEGKKVVVLNFKFKNTSKKACTLDTGSRGIIYTLVTENGTRIEAKTSLLENDVQFVNKEVKPGKTYKAVLLFFVDKADTSKGMKLELTGKDKKSEIVIK